MITGNEVFKLAMALIDEIGLNGEISTGAADYRGKAPLILTIINNELARIEGVDDPQIFSNLSAAMDISRDTAIKVMPYGLAYHLILDEDSTIASFFSNRYDELKRKIKPKAPIKIIDVYSSTQDI